MNDWCFKIPCRNSNHWKLFDASGKEVKDTVKRIDAMRFVWYGKTD